MTVKAALRGAAVTATAAVMLAVPTVAEAHNWHRHYYENYFRSFFTCQARGWGVLGYSFGKGDPIPGAVDFRCYARFGESKYTMDILFHFNPESWAPAPVPQP